MIPTIVEIPDDSNLVLQGDMAVGMLGWLDVPEGTKIDASTLLLTLEDVVVPVWAQLMLQDSLDADLVVKTLSNLLGLRGLFFLLGDELKPDDRETVERLLFKAFESAALWMLEHHQAELEGVT